LRQGSFAFDSHRIGLFKILEILDITPMALKPRISGSFKILDITLKILDITLYNTNPNQNKILDITLSAPRPCESPGLTALPAGQIPSKSLLLS